MVGWFAYIESTSQPVFFLKYNLSFTTAREEIQQMFSDFTLFVYAVHTSYELFFFSIKVKGWSKRSNKEQTGKVKIRK